MSAVSFNLSNYNKPMSESNRQPANSIGSFYGQKPNKHIVVDNVNGHRQDKLTSGLLKTTNDPHLTTYNGDFTGPNGAAPKQNNQQLLRQYKSEEKLSQAGPKYGYPNGQAPGQAQQGKPSLSDIRSNSNSGSNKKPKAQINSPNSVTGANRADAGRSDFASDTKSIYDVKCVHDDLKKSFTSNPKIHVANDAEYYETVRRLDVCGRCWSEQQKFYTTPFKLKEKNPGLTLYQKDFVAHPIEEKDPKIRNDFYGTLNLDEPMDFATNNRRDFQPWKIEPVEKANQNKAPKASVPFDGKGGYKADYINWGNMPVNYEKAPNNISVIPELPFVGKTSYGDNFGNKFPYERARPVDRDLWNNKAKSPLSPGIPFLAQTTNQRTFKPFKVGGGPMFSNKEAYEPTEAYPGQFKSLYDQDFVAPGAGKCPARVFIDTHPRPGQNV